MSILTIPLDRVLDEMEYVPAYWIREESTAVRRFIVIHCMGTPQTPAAGGRARNNASYFSRGAPDPNGVKRKASTHVGVDNVTGIRSVPDPNGCFGAAVTNFIGLHLEIAGNESLTREEWLSPEYGLPCLQNAAYVVAAWSLRFGIPIEYVGVEGLRDPNGEGLVTHNDCSIVGDPKGHSDPGPNFPMDELVRLATEYLNAFLTGGQPQGDWFDMATMADLHAVLRDRAWAIANPDGSPLDGKVYRVPPHLTGDILWINDPVWYTLLRNMGEISDVVLVNGWLLEPYMRVLRRSTLPLNAITKGVGDMLAQLDRIEAQGVLEGEALERALHQIRMASRDEVADAVAAELVAAPVLAL